MASTELGRMTPPWPHPGNPSSLGSSAGPKVHPRNTMQFSEDRQLEIRLSLDDGVASGSPRAAYELPHAQIKSLHVGTQPSRRKGEARGVPSDRMHAEQCMKLACDSNSTA